MNRLIKAAQAGQDTGLVRTLPIGSADVRAIRFDAREASDPVLLETEARLTDALERLAEEAAARAALEAERDLAYSEGERVGRERGRAETQSSEAEKLAAVELGITKALDVFSERLIGLDALTGAVAFEAVSKIFSAETDRSDLVVDAVRHQLASIAAGSVVRIELSAVDFPEPASLDTLRVRLGQRSLEIVALGEAPSGACRIVLRLGAIDCGLDRQLSRLEAVLGQLSKERS